MALVFDPCSRIGTICAFSNRISSMCPTLRANPPPSVVVSKFQGALRAPREDCLTRSVRATGSTPECSIARVPSPHSFTGRWTKLARQSAPATRLSYRSESCASRNQKNSKLHPPDATNPHKPREKYATSSRNHESFERINDDSKLAPKTDARFHPSLGAVSEPRRCRAF